MIDSRETLTMNAFVIGHPIKHSRSPMIHGHWLRQMDIDGTYRAVDVAPENIDAFFAGLKGGNAQKFRGGNVTIPHKESAFKAADCPDDLAQELGAANTVWLEDGKLHATNTDGYGFLANLDEQHPGWDKAKSAIILGAGGASRAIIQALRNRGIGEIHVLNRTIERAQELADRFGEHIHAHKIEALPEVMAAAGLFVNTTSLGMNGAQVPDIDFTVMASDAVVSDIVYVPLITPFLQMAQRQGLPTVDGLGMLLYQATLGFEKWFGQTPMVDAELRQIIIDDMEKH